MTGGNQITQDLPNIPFGKYQIFRKLAIGGMAELFLAKQIGLGGFERTVVLKCILPHLIQDEQFLTMFLDEARVASLLTHPNIVQIYEIGEVEGIFYIAMEYIRGPNLKAFRKRLYQRNPRPHYSLIAGVVAQAAAGLSHTHKATDEQGQALRIVHRDISPTNLLLSYSGSVKLVDFGVAKASIQEHKTRAGMVKGKYRYMSPEQILAQPIDQRSDLYALGAILYELATNVVVFGRRTEAETIRAVYEEPIMPPSRMIEGFPDELNDIIMKCLEREPDERYKTAKDVRWALEQFMHKRSQYFGTQETSDLLQVLFAEEQEYERTGLSGSSLSKADYFRFSPDASSPSLPRLPTGIQSSSGQLQGSSPSSSFPSIPSRNSFSAPPPEERTMPSAESMPKGKSGSFPNKEPSVRPTNIPFSSSDGLNKSAEPDLTHASPTDPEDVSKGISSWLILFLLVAVVGGGYYLWSLLLPSDSTSKQQTKLSISTKQKEKEFAPIATKIEGLLQRGSLLQANALLAPLKQHAKTPTQKTRAKQLEQKVKQHIRCSPKLAVAKEFYKRKDYHLAEKVLRSLQDRCSTVLEVQILLEQSIDAMKKTKNPPQIRQRVPFRAPVRPRRRRRRRRPSRRNRRRPIKRPKLRVVPVKKPIQRQAVPMGLLYINAPPLARVDLNGRLFGFTPINGKKLKAGRHKISIRLKGYHSYFKNIEVRKGRSTVLTIPMRKITRVKPRRTFVPSPPRRRTTRKRPKMSFSSVRLPKRRVLRVFITDPRGIGGRSYTDQHRILSRQIEREVKRLMGPRYRVRGITRPWLQYVRKYGARMGHDRLTFYPRAVAYVLYTQLKRGRKRSRIAQIIVNYERRRRWKRFRNR